MYSTVYVDSNKGLNAASCGSSFKPCNDLMTGVQQVRTSGTIVVVNRQNLKKTILLQKDVTIVGIKNPRPVVTGKMDFAFVTKTDVIVNISYLNFKNVGILSIESSAQINIQYVEVQGSSNIYQDQAKISVKKTEMESVTIVIMNSIFKDTGKVVSNCPKKRKKIKKSKKSKKSADICTTKSRKNNIRYVQIHHSIFTRTNGIQLKYIGTIGINNCSFLHHKARSALIGVQNGGNFTITLSRFVNGSSTTKGDFIFLRYLKNVRISHCIFKDGRNVYKPGGAMHVIFVKETEISYCTFSHCRAIRGGAISLINTGNRSSIVHCIFSNNKATTIGGALYINTLLLFRQIENRIMLAKLESQKLTDRPAHKPNSRPTDFI